MQKLHGEKFGFGDKSKWGNKPSGHGSKANQKYWDRPENRAMKNGSSEFRAHPWSNESEWGHQDKLHQHLDKVKMQNKKIREQQPVAYKGLDVLHPANVAAWAGSLFPRVENDRREDFLVVWVCGIVWVGGNLFLLGVDNDYREVLVFWGDMGRMFFCDTESSWDVAK